VSADRDGIEAEMKFAAWPGFEVPDLTDAVDGLQIHPGAEDLLDATYYDAKDLRLIRAGITVRHRTSSTGAVWTVKFPEGEGKGAGADGVLRRREIDVALPGGTVPERVAGLVRAFVRSEALEPVARLQTRRRRFELRIDDRSLGEVDDDEVSVLDGDRIAARFREVEVELREGPTKLSRAIEARLRDAGAAAADPTPKLVRALGPRALTPPDVPPYVLGDDASVGEVVHAGIVAAVRRILAHDHVIRLDDDPEGVHQARVGTRRLRSDLRTFRPVLDERWSEPLRDELEWLADSLGRVRDADVLRARLDAEVDLLPAEGDRDAARHLIARLDRERAEALGLLLADLDSTRYVGLLDRLVEAAHHAELTKAAGKRATKVLPDLVGVPYGKLVASASKLDRASEPAQYHRVRIHVKRARYAAEVAAPVIGAPARTLASALADAQDVLGDHQDACVAEDWLRRAALSAPPDQALAAGEMVASERLRAAELRARWPKVLERVGTKRSTAWL
jgi:CHAD domain-containing protein